MFSSNQIFEISGDMGQLECALKFALDYSGNSKRELVFQKTENGKFCIGWSCQGDMEGWEKFQFDFDITIVAKIIVQYLSKQPAGESPYDFADGSTARGFLMKDIPELFSDVYEGIRNPFYGIVSFEPHCNFYAK